MSLLTVNHLRCNENDLPVIPDARNHLDNVLVNTLEHNNGAMYRPVTNRKAFSLGRKKHVSTKKLEKLRHFMK